MSKPAIFISCGQYTEEEKQLGRAIARMVRTVAGLEPFFAEEVQDLNGLDANILGALRRCVGLIVVLHPRGTIERPDGSTVVRASLWVEQEIAIATYIQRVENRPLPIIAFRHSAVGREGMRDLLHLNPIEFSNEMEVLAALPERLREWKSLTPSGIQLQLASRPHNLQEGHLIRTLELIVINDTPRPMSMYDFEVVIPAGLLKHWSASHAGEVRSSDPDMRRFRFNQQAYGPVGPRSTRPLFSTAYCTQCADVDSASGPMTAESLVSATIWVDGGEYSVRSTTQELAAEASRRGEY